MNIFLVIVYVFILFSLVFLFYLEQISDGQEYDSRDLKRFNELDEYTLMFIQHGQHETVFNERKAFRYFHEAMTWRKQNNVYGTFFFILKGMMSILEIHELLF